VRPSVWSVRLATAAKADLEDIVQWTMRRFGAEQASVYRETISAALRALRNGPNIAGVRRRADIHQGLYTLHIARGRRQGRHLILFRLDQQDDRQLISVARILHDAMDVARHLPPEGLDPEAEP
jgi:toxin ParE1/3/4